MEDDYFGPRDPNCIRLPKKFKVNFIETENDITKLRSLIGSDLIGMDAEWNPKNRSERPAILQLSNQSTACIIDFTALANNRHLDDVLTQVFTDSRTICIGFAFSGDQRNFARHFPAMTFYKKFTRFIDLQAHYIRYYSGGSKQTPGLKTVVKELLNETLCKVEQVSDWDRRPLTKTQLHYGALDAFILVELAHEADNLARKQAELVENNCKTLTFSRGQRNQNQQER